MNSVWVRPTVGRWASGVIFCLAFAGFASAANAQANVEEKKPAELTPVQKIIEQDVIPAYRVGNRFALELGIKKLASRIKVNEIGRVNNELLSRESERLERLFLSVRLPKVPYSPGSAAPTNSIVELQLVLRSLSEHIQNKFAQLKKDFELASHIPESYREFEEKLWQIDGLHGDISSLTETIQYFQNLRKHGRRDYRKKLDSIDPHTELPQLIADNSFEPLLKELGEMRIKAVEQELLTRIYRLENAVADLPKEGLSTKSKIEAAMVVAVDGKVIPDLLKTHRKQLTNPDLNNEELPVYIRSMIDETTEAHPRLVEIGGRLYFGMQLWLQGRYGFASDYGGLVKQPFTFARASSQGEIYMPPIPYSKRVANQTLRPTVRPGIERRHFYVSAYPYRQLDCRRMVPYVPTGPVASPAKPKPYSKSKSGSGGYVSKPGSSYQKTPGISYQKKPGQSYVIPPGRMYRTGPAGTKTPNPRRGSGGFL